MATLKTTKKLTLKGLGKPILIASHPRSGTHLTIDLFRKQFQECQSQKNFGEPLNRLYCGLDSQNLLSEQDAIKNLSKCERPLVKTHNSPQFIESASSENLWVRWLQENADIYYIIRDGRSVMCSLHLFMQSYDPLARCSLSEFIRQEVHGVSRVKHWSDHIQNFLVKPNVKVLRFENIINNTQSILTEIGEELQLKPLWQEPYLPEKANSLWYGRWQRLVKKNSESTAIIGYYRGQKVQKWQQVFTPEDRQFFQIEAGKTLLELDYEQSDNWV